MLRTIQDGDVEQGGVLPTAGKSEPEKIGLLSEEVRGLARRMVFQCADPVIRRQLFAAHGLSV